LSFLSYLDLLSAYHIPSWICVRSPLMKNADNKKPELKGTGRQLSYFIVPAFSTFIKRSK